jgi:hypothetical protein
MAAMKQLHPDLKDWQVKLLMIKEKMAQMVNHREMAGSLSATPVPEYGRAPKGHVLPDGYPGV